MCTECPYCIFVYPSEHAHVNMYGETFIGSTQTLDEARIKAEEYVSNGAFVSIVKDVYEAPRDNKEVILSKKYGEEVDDLSVAKWVHLMKICGEMD